MPTILTKKSDTPGSVPATGNLTNAAGGAELAVNTADKRLFTITSGSAVVEIGTNPSSLTCSDASFTLMKAASASITNLTATSLVLSNLSIASANVTTLTSASATITNLLATSLTVSSGSTLNGGVVINELGADADTRIEGDTDANLVFVDASTDRVGFGTNAPGAKVHSAGGILSTGSVATAVANAGILDYTAADSVTRLWATGANNSTQGTLIFVTASANASVYNERMRLDASGNLGLGVTPASFDSSAVKALQIGAQAAFAAESTVAHVLTNAYYNAAWKYIGTGNATDYYQLNGTHVWRTAASGTAGNTISWTQAMTLDASGILSLGVSGARLSFTGTSGDKRIGQGDALVTGGGSTDFAMQATNAILFATGGTTERARITSGGKWIVNDTAASGNDELVVIKATSTSSTAAAIRIINSAGTELFFVRNDGAFRTGTGATSPVNLTTGNAANVWVDTDGTLRKSTSSIKYKDNVQDSTHGLAEVLALRPVTYNGKNDGEKIFGGLIAEEVHDAGLTEFVQYADDGSPDALAYGNMVSLAIKAIQEQQAMIDDLKAKVAALEAK